MSTPPSAPSVPLVGAMLLLEYIVRFPVLEGVESRDRDIAVLA